MTTTTLLGRPLLTVAQVATLLGRSRWTIYSMTESGELPHVQVGRALMFLPDEIDALLREQRGIGAGRRPKPRKRGGRKAAKTAAAR